MKSMIRFKTYFGTFDKKICCVLILITAMVALTIRLPRLSQRPLHTDEAVHAYKFGRLVDENYYRYDQNEYHGSTLNYFTLIPAWLSGQFSSPDVSESVLRVVPVFFSVVLILLLLLMLDGLSPPVTVIAAVLTAVSPAFVFYGRYYIQETLLVCFIFGAIAAAWRYIKRPSGFWALLTGIFLGLAHSTKETDIIAFGSIFLAFVLVIILEKKKNIFSFIRVGHIIICLAAFGMVSCLFFSSFFTNPVGIIDSIKTYSTYFNRAGDNGWHIHPWYFYLKQLFFFKFGAGPIFSEAIVIVLAMVGVFAAFSRRKLVGGDRALLKFIAIYTILMTVIYSAVPYKTPWCMLGFLNGMILMAGVGAVAIVGLLNRKYLKALAVTVMVLFTAHLGWQSYLANYKYPADPANPYVYAHTDDDVLKIVDRIELLATAHPDAYKMPVQVICPGADYWPFPWYLRKFKNIELLSQAQFEQRLATRDIRPAPVVLAYPSLEPQILKMFYELPPPGKRDMYVPMFKKAAYLRPGVELLCLVQMDLSDDYRNLESQRKNREEKMKNLESDDKKYVEWEDVKNKNHFVHEAMYTTFHVFMIHEDPELAAQIAETAFREVDRLENELSRFVSFSDVSRINQLEADTPLMVGMETFECLEIAKRVSTETNGAFDMTVGTLFSCFRNEDRSPRVPTEDELVFARAHTGSDKVILDEEGLSVTLTVSPMKLDIGGVGKGYAVDKMAEVFKEWDIEAALLLGGNSSILAIGSPPGMKGWPLSMSDPSDLDNTFNIIYLRDRAFGSSGQKECKHIIDPRTEKPAEGKVASWSSSIDAATSDALSTAFIIMSPSEIEEYIEKHPENMALVIVPGESEELKEGRILKYGNWGIVE